MKSKKILFIGLAVIAVASVSNLQWSLNDYGLRTISLTEKVFAQGTTKKNFWDKVKDKIWEYAEYKRDSGQFRTVKRTSGAEISGTANIGDSSISGSIGSTTEITQREYLYVCQQGTARIFCSSSWEDAPNLKNVD